MANPESGKKNRSLRESLRDSAADNGRGLGVRGQSPPNDDPWLRKENEESGSLDKTSDEENEEILQRVRQEEEAKPKDRRDDEDAGSSEELEKVTAENQELRSIIAELKQCLEEQTSQGKPEQSWEDREREYEAMIEQKSDAIRELHLRVQDLEKQASESGGGGSGDEAPEQEELLALSDELERERCQLEQERQSLDADRRQLREDEESMMRQMREMELQMAKERAELARQRTELQRMHSEIRHELELAQRDAAVRERLEKLQRRHQQADPSSGEEEPRKKSGQTAVNKPSKGSGSTGIFGRLFGGDK
jgi:hypothetical protein